MFSHGCVLLQVTGQEVMKVPGSAHVACTVEMAALNTHADVAVIDEIQVRQRLHTVAVGACCLYLAFACVLQLMDPCVYDIHDNSCCVNFLTW